MEGMLYNSYYPNILPIGPYIITMRLTDAGGVGDSTDTTFTLRLGFNPTFVREYSFTSSSGRTEKFVIIQVPSIGADPYTPGYYAYANSWVDLISGGSVILIPSTGYSCPSGWLYNSSDLALLITDTRLCIDPLSTTLPISTTITTTGYTFSFS
jgi:hypothetical protein